MAVMAFVVGASFCFLGEKWRTSSAFYFVNRLPLPWWLYGGLLVVAAGCLIVEKYRPVGYLIGAIIYSFFALMVWLSVLGGLHATVFPLKYLDFPSITEESFFGACNLSTIAVLYWSALRYSIYAQVDPESPKLSAVKQ